MTNRQTDGQKSGQSDSYVAPIKHLINFQELNETRTRTTTEIEEVDSGLREEYQAKLAEALQNMREEQNIQIQDVRSEVELLYEKKVREERLLLQEMERRFILFLKIFTHLRIEGVVSMINVFQVSEMVAGPLKTVNFWILMKEISQSFVVGPQWFEKFFRKTWFNRSQEAASPPSSQISRSAYGAYVFKIVS